MHIHVDIYISLCVCICLQLQVYLREVLMTYGHHVLHVTHGQLGRVTCLTSGPTWCRWKSWLLQLLVLREVKDSEPEGLPRSRTALQTEYRAPLMRRLALALRPLDR